MNELEIDLAWGGIYASRSDDSDDYRIFRLLDFNRDAYHAALYGETFEHAPTFGEVEGLSPLIGHVPIASKGLLNRPGLELLGNPPLASADLQGYGIYLEQHGADPVEIEDLMRQVIDFSKRAPVRLRLRLVGEELEIEGG